MLRRRGVSLSRVASPAADETRHRAPRAANRRRAAVLPLLGRMRADRHPLDPARGGHPRLHAPLGSQPRPRRPLPAPLGRPRRPHQSVLGFPGRRRGPSRPAEAAPLRREPQVARGRVPAVPAAVGDEVPLQGLDLQDPAARLADADLAGHPDRARQPGQRAGGDRGDAGPADARKLGDRVPGGHAQPRRLGRAVSRGSLPPRDRARRRRRSPRRRREPRTRFRSTRSSSSPRRRPSRSSRPFRSRASPRPTLRGSPSASAARSRRRSALPAAGREARGRSRPGPRRGGAARDRRPRAPHARRGVARPLRESRGPRRAEARVPPADRLLQDPRRRCSRWRVSPTGSAPRAS